MISRKGIYYDLKKSVYQYKINGLTYVFSSELHMNKFKAQHVNSRDNISISLSNRFGYRIYANIISDIALYVKIETRGFLIITRNGVEIDCREKIILNGETVTIRS